MPTHHPEKSNNSSAKQSRKKQFTDTFVKKLKSNGKRVTHSDISCRGLSLRLGTSGTKTWSFMGRDCHGKNRTETIGRYPEISLKAARDEADRLRGIFAVPEKLSIHLAPATVTESITLLELLIEAEVKLGSTTKIWRPRGNKTDVSTARQVISTVFEPMLHRHVCELTPERASSLVETYRPKSRDRTGKETANGQSSRALSYLRTVFNWASCRTKRFKKLGAGRKPCLALPDLTIVNDPSVSDTEILGKRERVLDVFELKRVLPHLTLGERATGDWWEIDLRPIAHRFILLTLSRLEEVEAARWRDLNFQLQTWTKTVKGGSTVTHPLSEPAIELLKSLPGYGKQGDDDLVFPNQNFGELGNWDRSTKAIQLKSETSDWHRHDLRRTGATILLKMGVSVHVIDTLLSHKNPMSNEAVSPALQSYAILANEMQGLPDPLRDAVQILSHVIQVIENGDYGGD